MLRFGNSCECKFINVYNNHDTKIDTYTKNIFENKINYTNKSKKNDEYITDEDDDYNNNGDNDSFQMNESIDAHKNKIYQNGITESNNNIIVRKTNKIETYSDDFIDSQNTNLVNDSNITIRFNGITQSNAILRKKSDMHENNDNIYNNDNYNSDTVVQGTSSMSEYNGININKNNVVLTTKKIINHKKNDDEEETKKYIDHMNKIVNDIKNMSYGDTIYVNIDPNNSTLTCAIKKIVKYDTYIFSGHGSKNMMKYFIKNTYDELRYIYYVQILDSQTQRRFFPIKNWVVFWKSYMDVPINDRHLFEIISSDMPCKPYLDIEWEENNAHKKTHNKFIVKIKKDIMHIFSERYNITLPKKSILILTSHSIKKASFHIIIDHIIDKQCVMFETNKKGFKNSAWDFCYALFNYDKSYENVLDKNVYTTDREFRTIYSNKSNEYRPMLPLKIKKKTDIGEKEKNNNEKYLTPEDLNIDIDFCMKYIVTYASTEKKYIIETPSYMNYNVYIPNESFTPIKYTDKKIIELINLIRPIHPTAEYTGNTTTIDDVYGWRFTYSDKNEPCYTGNYHNSNGFYVYEDTIKKITYMKCMSDRCKTKHILVDNRIKKTKRLF
jgi:hypothetical protein